MSSSRVVAALLDELSSVLPADGMLARASELLVYDHDGSTLHGARPSAVVLPRTREQVVACVRACHRHGVPFVARGAGTGLSGGAMALDGAVVIGLNRLDRVLAVRPDDRLAVVEPGVRNLAVSEAAAPHGLYYAPDPSSQAVCSIGGNVAHNSGGPHTLKSGVTVNHVRGLQLVRPDGAVLELCETDPGDDLLALVTGSEGTFGIVTRVELNLLPVPETVRTLLAAYPDVAAACEAVSAIIGAGLVPAALELLDAEVVDALAAAFGFRFPAGAGALLLVETDGPEPGMDDEVAALEHALRDAGALELRAAADAAERADIWKARKQAFGALGRIARHYYTQDGVIPRTRLPEMLRHVQQVAADHELRVANVFHAGDGNLHPCLLFDSDDAETRRRVLDAGAAILRHCVELGGSLTGEHGVGVEKREWMAFLFDAVDLDVMKAVRDGLDPSGLCNPDKVLPLGGGCHELPPRAKQVAS